MNRIIGWADTVGTWSVQYCYACSLVPFRKYTPCWLCPIGFIGRRYVHRFVDRVEQGSNDR